MATDNFASSVLNLIYLESWLKNEEDILTRYENY